MVATDVASRGIGMIDCDLAPPLPFLSPPLMSCGSVCVAVLSAFICSVSAIIWFGLIVSHIDSLALRILDIQCSVNCYASYSVSLRTKWVQRRIRLCLNCSFCISSDNPGPR